MRVGDAVVAVGNPFGLGGTVTSGIVSATGREIGSGPYDDFLQIDAPINRGNSGGPTFNLKGEVVGVNSAIFSPSGGSVGIGFAISSNLAKQVVADLEDDGKVERGWLGVQIQGVDEDLAANLELGQAARRAGQRGRSRTARPRPRASSRATSCSSFDGKPIDQVGQLSRAVAAVRAGHEGRDRGLARRQGEEARGRRSARCRRRTRWRAAEPAEAGRRSAASWVWPWPPI